MRITKKRDIRLCASHRDLFPGIMCHILLVADIPKRFLGNATTTLATAMIGGVVLACIWTL